MKALIILLNKILYQIGKLFHKGSSMPGKVALKIDKNILKKISLPDNIIMVTGSNGKTSTTEMICSVLRENGKTVACNTEGANQLAGVTTMVLNNTKLSGEMKKDVLLIEVDERSLKIILQYIRPKYLVVTNLYRDQLTRNGHPEFIYDEIKRPLTDDIHLVLNTDDPLSSLLGYQKKNVTYYGMEENSLSKKENTSVYHDGKYCPNCKHKMQYEYFHFNQVGAYKCPNCGHERKKPDYAVTSLNMASGELTINRKYTLQLNLRSVYNAYNTLATFAVCRLIGVKDDLVVQSLSNYSLKNDRIQVFNVGGHETMLLTSKHENSISYNQSLLYITRENIPCTVVVIVDAISRKYFTSDTSWLWDIDFELLQSENVKKVILAGKYVHDLNTRMQFAGIHDTKIVSKMDLDEMMREIKEHAEGKVFVVTCFSDRMKLINRIK